jgi:hypothetical protein
METSEAHLNGLHVDVDHSLRLNVSSTCLGEAVDGPELT